LYFSNWGGEDPVGNVIKNNIFFDNNYGSVCYDGTFAPPEIVSNWDDNGTDPGFVDLSGIDPNDPTLPDLSLVVGSTAEDAGDFLTTITSPSSTSNTFEVADAAYFTDGWGAIDGDLIQLSGQSQTARITQVDYGTNSLTVDQSLTFETGQGITLAYAGSAPDLGAFEIIPGQ
jgi:hypothetical protein